MPINSNRNPTIMAPRLTFNLTRNHHPNQSIVLVCLCRNPTIVALHIDYANRAESGQEANYVELWCGEWGIAFRSVSSQFWARLSFFDVFVFGF